jgi:hypothetical protein
LVLEVCLVRERRRRKKKKDRSLVVKGHKGRGHSSILLVEDVPRRHRVPLAAVCPPGGREREREGEVSDTHVCNV